MQKHWPKLIRVEAAIAWAAQQGYVFSKEAARELEAFTGREMVEDQPYYNNYKWQNCSWRK